MKTVKIVRYLPLLALVAMVSCKGKTTNEEVSIEEKKVAVKVASAYKMDVDQIEEYTGTVEAYKQNNISPAMPLRIDKIHVEVGDRVAAGQLIATMDNTQYTQATLQLEMLELDLSRVENLLKAGAVSQQNYDDLKTQVEISRKTASNLKQNMQLTSPMSGIISARNYDNGDMFAGLPVATVMQMQPVIIRINVPEVHYPQMKKGMPINVKLDTYGDKMFGGKIHLIYPTIDQQTRSFSVEVSIPNSDLAVRPGMFARIELNYGKESSVMVPDLAVQRQEGTNERYVFIVKDGKAHRKSVQLGRRIEDKFVILSGVEEGDEVVTAGQAHLIEGTAITIQNEG